MNRTIIHFLLLVLLLPFAANAQLDSTLLTKYPASVIYRVYKITSHARIGPSRQLKLARHFHDLDSMADVALKNGRKVKDLAPFYESDTAALRAILLPLEYLDYRVSTDSTRSWIEKALFYRNSLGISKEQMDTLVSTLHAFEQLNNTDPMRKEKKEVMAISSILTDAQVKKLYMADQRGIAREKVLKYWKDVLTYNLPGKNDSADTYKKLYGYEMNVLTNTLHLTALGDEQKLKNLKRYLDKSKPEVLIQLEALKARYPALLALSIKFSKEISLDEKQRGDLLDGIVKIEKLRLASAVAKESNNTKKSFDDKKEEGLLLHAVLTEKQLDQLIQLSQKEKAALLSKTDISQLEKAGLIEPNDTAEVYAQHFRYHLSRLMAETTTLYGSHPEGIDSVRISYTAKKPLILLKLEILQGQYAKDDIAQVMKYAREIGLKKDQEDELLKSLREKPKVEAKLREANPGKRLDLNKYEMAQIHKILDDKQFAIFLQAKNRINTLNSTEKDWIELEKAGLINADAKKEIRKQLLKYHMRRLIAEDRVYTDDSPMNLALRNQAVSEKPEVLVQLELYLKDAARIRAERAALTW